MKSSNLRCRTSQTLYSNISLLNAPRDQGMDGRPSIIDHVGHNAELLHQEKYSCNLGTPKTARFCFCAVVSLTSHPHVFVSSPLSHSPRIWLINNLTFFNYRQKMCSDYNLACFYVLNFPTHNIYILLPGYLCFSYFLSYAICVIWTDETAGSLALWKNVRRSAYTNPFILYCFYVIDQTCNQEPGA